MGSVPSALLLFFTIIKTVVFKKNIYFNNFRRNYFFYSILELHLFIY